MHQFGTWIFGLTCRNIVWETIKNCAIENTKNCSQTTAAEFLIGFWNRPTLCSGNVFQNHNVVIVVPCSKYINNQFLILHVFPDRLTCIFSVFPCSVLESLFECNSSVFREPEKFLKWKSLILKLLELSDDFWICEICKKVRAQYCEHLPVCNCSTCVFQLGHT